MKGKWLLNFRLLLILVSVSFFLGQKSLQAEPSPSVIFTHGVASGDVRPTRAVLWTRVNRETSITVEVSSDPSFGTIVFTETVQALVENDFTVKVIAKRLSPDITYFYRWIDSSSVMSDVGTFKTPPSRFVSTAVLRFAFSGDSDGELAMELGGIFDVLNAALNENPDFFVYLGDTIYPNITINEGDGILDGYRDAYKLNRSIEDLANLLKGTSTYAIWDDHEVLDDFDGQTVDPILYLTGRRAFLEYMPIREPKFFLRDPDCAGDPLFRVFHWGKDVDIIILDERSCRSADVEAFCLIEVSPGIIIPDPAPTLPPIVRVLISGQSGLPLPPFPPAGCLEAIFNPTRTMLGRVQLFRLKAALLFSKAKFKFVINEVPIQQFYAFPYDRWEGYGAERFEILNFIRLFDISNVIFLTANTHANLVNEVFIDRFLLPSPVAEEFVTGPIARETLLEDLIDEGIPGLVDAFHAVLDLVGVDCRELDAFSYGLVDVDATAGTATVTLKDEDGVPFCTKTIGP